MSNYMYSLALHVVCVCVPSHCLLRCRTQHAQRNHGTRTHSSDRIPWNVNAKCECDRRVPDRVCRRNKLFRCCRLIMQRNWHRECDWRTSLYWWQKLHSIGGGGARKHTIHRICNYIVQSHGFSYGRMHGNGKMSKHALARFVPRFAFAFVRRWIKVSPAKIQFCNGERRRTKEMERDGAGAGTGGTLRNAQSASAMAQQTKCMRAKIKKESCERAMLFVNTTRICCYRFFIMFCLYLIHATCWFHISSQRLCVALVWRGLAKHSIALLSRCRRSFSSSLKSWPRSPLLHVEPRVWQSFGADTLTRTRTP